MTRHLFAIALLSLLGIWFSATAADENPPVPKGTFRGEIVDPVKKDVIMKVAMHTPTEVFNGRPFSLIFLCHGYQGNEGNYIGLTVEALKRIGLDQHFVVISGKSKGPGWTTDDDEPVLRMLDWASANYPAIDKRRVILFGSSNGAAYVGRFGSQHPERFAGVVGYCGNYKFDMEKLKADNPIDTRTEWYFVHGSKDNPQNSRRACDTLKAAGYRPIFRQMDGYGHTDIWDSRGHANADAANAVRDDWLWWMYALRHKEMKISEAQEKTLASVVESIRTETESRKVLESMMDARLVGGPAAGKAMRYALESDKQELRGAVAYGLRYTRFDRGTEGRVLKLLDDQKIQGYQVNAVKAAGVLANWRNEDAQQGLIAFVRDVKRGAELRAQAAEALGHAIRLACLGNFEDTRPFWTLVLLLDDEQAGVRAAAFKALQAGVKQDHGYKPELAGAERKAAVGKWHEWCKEKCGECPSDLQKK